MPEDATCHFKTLQQLNYTRATQRRAGLLFYAPSIQYTPTFGAELRLKIEQSEVLSYNITTTHYPHSYKVVQTSDVNTDLTYLIVSTHSSSMQNYDPR